MTRNAIDPTACSLSRPTKPLSTLKRVREPRHIRWNYFFGSFLGASCLGEIFFRYFSGFFWNFPIQALQQNFTSCPLCTMVTGVPIEPNLFPLTMQKSDEYGFTSAAEAAHAVSTAMMNVTVFCFMIFFFLCKILAKADLSSRKAIQQSSCWLFGFLRSRSFRIENQNQHRSRARNGIA